MIFSAVILLALIIIFAYNQFCRNKTKERVKFKLPKVQSNQLILTLTSSFNEEILREELPKIMPTFVEPL